MKTNEFLENIKSKYGLNKKLYEILVEASKNPKKMREINDFDNEDLMFAQGVYHLRHRGFCTLSGSKNRIELTELGREVCNEGIIPHYLNRQDRPDLSHRI